MEGSSSNMPRPKKKKKKIEQNEKNFPGLLS